MKQPKSSVSYIGKEYRNDPPVINIPDKVRHEKPTTKMVRFSDETPKKVDKKEQTVEEKEVNTDKVSSKWVNYFT